MAPVHIDSRDLAGLISEISLDASNGDNTSTDASTVSTSQAESDPPVDPTKSLQLISPTPNPRTLLTIPQELRNAIFSYVYAIADPDTPIGLHIVSADLAGISSHEALPTKASLLVCRQLHTEFKKLQAAALQQYWTTQTFLMNPSGARRANLHLTIVPNKPIQHITRLDVECYIKHLGHLVVKLRFSTQSGWTATAERAPSAGSGVPQMSNSQVHQLGALVRHVNGTVTRMLRNRLRNNNQAVIDPTLGMGFGVRELDQLCSAVR